MGAEEKEVRLDIVETVKSEQLVPEISDIGLSSGFRPSSCSLDKDSSRAFCRVCHCTESDLRGDAALGFLGISPPVGESFVANKNHANVNCNDSRSSDKNGCAGLKKFEGFPAVVEFIGPEGEVFVCSSDVEAGISSHEESLIYLGCSCKNDLALAHYACALKWFINHGSTICEICGNVAENVRLADFAKVLTSLKLYEDLRERTASGQITTLRSQTHAGVDPDAVAGIRRQRLSEISSWFNLHSSSVLISHGPMEQALASPRSDTPENHNTTGASSIRGALGSTGFVITIGLIVVLIAWFIAPLFKKRGAEIIFHLLVGVVCALAAILFARLVVPRLRYGPTLHWGISFISCFLVLGVWSTRTYTVRHS